MKLAVRILLGGIAFVAVLPVLALAAAMIEGEVRE